MKRLIGAIALLAALSGAAFSGAALADTPGDGIIDVQMVNGTADGSGAVGDQATLRTYQGEAQVSSLTIDADSDGQFVFSGLDTAPDYVYQASAWFNGAEYYSEPASFAEGETMMTAGITVYDTTTGTEGIMVAMSHMIISSEDGLWRVKEYYLFVNQTDRTYVGDTGDPAAGVLRLPLPPEATGFQPTLGLTDGVTMDEDGGFSEVTPIQPGMTEIGYSYAIPPASGGYTISRTMDYPVSQFDVLVSGTDLTVTSDSLAAGEPLDISGVQYGHLSRTGFATGDSLDIHLGVTSQGGTWGNLPWVMAGIVVVGAIATPIYLRRRRGRRRSTTPTPTINPETRRRKLLTEIARLDDDFEDGRIDAESYQRLRDEKKAALIKLADPKEKSKDR